MNILEIFEEKKQVITAVEIKPFGTVIRSIGEKELDKIRSEAFSRGWITPISCHREEGSTEAFMIVWNK